MPDIRVREWALAVCAVAATAIVSTWPLATSPWLVPAHQDPLFSSWRLYQWARNLSGAAPGGLFSGNIFYPASDVLLYSDAIALPAVAAAPFVLMGVPVVLVYTVLVWTAYLSAGLAMYACARELSGSRFGAVAAAAIFTGAPSRLDHVMHLELLITAFMPLALLATARLLRGHAPSARWLGIALGAQFLSSIYYGVFFFTVWPILAGVEWLRARPALPRAVLTRTSAAVALAALVAGLYALPYQRARSVVGDRADFEVDRYSATLDSYAVSPPANLAWGWTGGEDDAELRLFPGLVAGALAASAILTPAAPWTLALAAGAVFSVDASTGLHGWTYPAMRRLLPPYRGLRVPARFGALTLMCVALLAAIGCANLSRALGGRPGGPAMAAAVLLLMGVEFAAVVPVRAMPPKAPPVYQWLAGLPPTVIVHVPLPEPDALPGPEADYQYFAQYHRHRLINGNSGFYPPEYLRLLGQVTSLPDDPSITVLREAGAQYLLVHEQFYPTGEAFARVVLALDSRRDVTPVATSADDRGTVRVYSLARPRPGPGR